MDAYELVEQVKQHWSQLAVPTSGTSAKKHWPTIPVYVQVNGTLYQVKNCYLTDKIILTT